MWLNQFPARPAPSTGIRLAFLSAGLLFGRRGLFPGFRLHFRFGSRGRAARAENGGVTFRELLGFRQSDADDAHGKSSSFRRSATGGVRDGAASILAFPPTGKENRPACVRTVNPLSGGGPWAGRQAVRTERPARTIDLPGGTTPMYPVAEQVQRAGRAQCTGLLQAGRLVMPAPMRPVAATGRIGPVSRVAPGQGDNRVSEKWRSRSSSGIGLL